MAQPKKKKKKPHQQKHRKFSGGGVSLTSCRPLPADLLALSSGAYLALLTLCPPHSIKQEKHLDPSLWSDYFDEDKTVD